MAGPVGREASCASPRLGLCMFETLCVRKFGVWLVRQQTAMATTTSPRECSPAEAVLGGGKKQTYVVSGAGFVPCLALRTAASYQPATQQDNPGNLGRCAPFAAWGEATAGASLSLRRRTCFLQCIVPPGSQMPWQARMCMLGMSPSPVWQQPSRGRRNVAACPVSQVRGLAGARSRMALGHHGAGGRQARMCRRVAAMMGPPVCGRCDERTLTFSSHMAHGPAENARACDLVSLRPHSYQST